MVKEEGKYEPMVSVIVATYRRYEELRNALCSLAEQTYKQVEIILVDDNADAEWNQRIHAMAMQIGHDTGVDIKHIINERNMGSAATRNKGIASAQGAYITFLDDDDVYLPEKIEMQLKDMLASDAEYGITDLYLYNGQGILVDKRIRSYIKEIDTRSLMCNHLMHHMTGTDTLMFKAEYLRKIGGFPGIDVGDEFYLMKEAILGCGRCFYSNHCYVKAYIHTGENGGLSSGQKKIDGENALYAEKKKYFSFLSKTEVGYVKMRHYAVLAFAEYRRKRMLHFMGYAMYSFACAPMGMIKMILSSR